MKSPITKATIEEWILLFLDKELSVDQEQQLKAFLDHHEEYRELLSSYQATHLLPDPQLTFPEKEQLLREEAAAPPLMLRRRPTVYFAAAALLILILGVWLLWLYPQSRPDTGALPTCRLVATSGIRPPVAVDNTPHRDIEKTKTVPTTPIKPPVLSKKMPDFIAPATSPSRWDPEAEETIALHRLPTIKTPLAMPISLGMRYNTNMLPAPSMRQIHSKASANPTAAAEPTATVTISIPAWVPVDGDRLQGINDLIGQMQEVKQKLLSDLSELNLSAVAVQVGNQRIILGKKDSF